MTATRPLALVTGASSGIGAEISVELAKHGYDLLLTGRDSTRLSEVAARVQAQGASSETLVVDLGQPTPAVAALVKALGDRPLAVLVNNAGFGLSGPLMDSEASDLAAMITLNVTALTLLTRALVPAMVARQAGRILNVASTASFQPIPEMAVYGATKAFVLSFSAALAEELSGTGVTVTALCPGPTTTRFADRASMTSSALFKKAMSADVVARIGLKALFRGRRVRVAGAGNAFMAFSVRFSPLTLTAKVARMLMKKP